MLSFLPPSSIEFIYCHCELNCDARFPPPFLLLFPLSSQSRDSQTPLTMTIEVNFIIYLCLQFIHRWRVFSLLFVGPVRLLAWSLFNVKGGFLRIILSRVSRNVVVVAGRRAAAGNLIYHVVEILSPRIIIILGDAVVHWWNGGRVLPITLLATTRSKRRDEEKKKW